MPQGLWFRPINAFTRRSTAPLSGAFRGDDLGKWFGEKWVRITSSGGIAGPCGGRSSKEGKPKCLPRQSPVAVYSRT